MREVYAFEVEAGVWLFFVSDSDCANAVFVYIRPSLVVFSRRYSGFGEIDVAFVFCVFVG